jgi:RNA polymerase sigma-70 factor (ECF subfamily)
MFTHAELMSQRAGLHRFAFQLARNAPDADDLLQATLLRAMEKMHLFQPGTSLFKWGSKIMYNLFVSEYRRKVRFQTQYDPEYYIDGMSQSASQESHMELSEVNDAMQRLTPEHREVLILIAVYGMRYDDVAKTLQIPVGTVRSRLSRARQSLDALLNESKSSALTPVQPVVQDNSAFAQRAA